MFYLINCIEVSDLCCKMKLMIQVLHFIVLGYVKQNKTADLINR